MMETKLIKLGKDKYTLIYKKDGMTVEHNPELDGNLSLKNCQAIENGYDLMKLAEENSHKYYDVKTTDWHCNYNGFFSGFQKALEILGDKKFNYSHLDKMFTCGKLYQDSKNEAYCFNNVLNKFQQTEWDVEIEMEEVPNMDYKPSFGGGSDSHYNPMYVSQPKLDADGCLILKRI